MTEAALARITERDPALHAISALRAEAALADADALDAGGHGHDGRLAGVPVAIKEELDVADMVTTFGGRANTTPAAADCESVRRLRAAGAVVVAKTAMPEFGQFPFTESAARGSTHNPWDRTRSTGGSSGGSAAAVASGMVPVAMGGDGGGSIRIPASCCGLVGLKPMRGRVSTAPYAALWGALGTLGPLTRTVADTALVYDVLAGSTPTDRWSAPAPRRPFLEAATHDPEPLRIAWTTKPVLPGTRVDPQVAAATEATAEALAGLGHHVERFDPRWPVPTSAFIPQFYGSIREETGYVEHPERLEWRTRATARLGGWARPGVVAAAERSGERVAAALTERLAGWDLLITPTIGSLLQMALSRTREFEADLDAAMLTGDPDGLSSALVKLERIQGRRWEMMLPGGRIPEPSILRSHPRTEERVARLKALKLEDDDHFSNPPRGGRRLERRRSPVPSIPRAPQVDHDEPDGIAHPEDVQRAKGKPRIHVSRGGVWW